MDYEIDAELVERNKRFGITVRRAPVNYVGNQHEVIQPVKIKRPRGPNKATADLTPEEIKKRKAERALHWYHERKNDPELKEKRKAYAKEYYSTKKDK